MSAFRGLVIAIGIEVVVIGAFLTAYHLWRLL